MAKFSTIGTCDTLNTVKVQNWFVGFITKPSVERFLNKKGEYLIYSEEKNGSLKFILSVRDNKRCHHFTLTNKEKIGWLLDAESNKTFGAIQDLIQYYETNMLPMNANLFLLSPFQRPKWFQSFLQNNFLPYTRFIKNEYVAYDVVTGLIGTGNFSNVYEGKLFGKMSVALKIYHKPTGESTNLDEAKESLVHEACLMSQFKHPNVVKFHGICYDIPSICIIMEQCTGGSLDNHLQQWACKITTGERILYGLEAAKGMCYLQEKALIHRDLATRNCLISKYGIIKISDFGLSLSVNEQVVALRKQKLPIRWMAPETIHRKPRYSAKSDVWSYGVLLYEIFNNGVKPWPDLDVRQCAANIRRGIMPNMPKITPKEVIYLVNKCWKISVEKRCDFKYIVRKLKKLQLSFAPPKITDLTIAKLKNVGILTEEEAETQEQNDDHEMESMSEIVSGITSTVQQADSVMKVPQNNADTTSSAYSVLFKKDEQPERNGQEEQEMAIMNDAILEYVAAEIKKLLSSRRKNKRKHKSKKKLDRKHRRSHGSVRRSSLKEGEGSSREGRKDSAAKEREDSIQEDSASIEREDSTPKVREDSAPMEREDSESKGGFPQVSSQSIGTHSRKSEASSEERESYSSEISNLLKEIENVSGVFESETFPKESENLLMENNPSLEMKESDTCQTKEKVISGNTESQNENALDADHDEKMSEKNAMANSNDIPEIQK